MVSQRFFISFNSADRLKAHWIAWSLKEAGHEVAVHDWEIPAGGNAPLWMNAKLAWADRLVAVISPDYAPARYSPMEWASQLWDAEAHLKRGETPSKRTKAVWWAKLQPFFQEERKRGVLAVDAKTPSTMLAHKAGYIDRDNEVVAGLQTDEPFKRAIFPFGGLRMMVEAGLKAAGWMFTCTSGQPSRTEPCANCRRARGKAPAALRRPGPTTIRPKRAATAGD